MVLKSRLAAEEMLGTLRGRAMVSVRACDTLPRKGRLPTCRSSQTIHEVGNQKHVKSAGPLREGFAKMMPLGFEKCSSLTLVFKNREKGKVDYYCNYYVLGGFGFKATNLARGCFCTS